MGTITRSFANNITTSGILLPASLNNNSIANVTAYNPAIPTGNMVLISTATASSSATIDFTLGSYKEYQFYFINLRPSVNDAGFQCNFSIDSGSNYNVTKTSTFFVCYNEENNATTSLSYQSSSDLSQSTGDNYITLNTGNTADDNLGGVFTLFNPSSTTYVKHWISDANEYTNTYSIRNFNAGYANTTSALTNIRFKFASGNIVNGQILMYGIN
jgi:hypothetical protein